MCWVQEATTLPAKPHSFIFTANIWDLWMPKNWHTLHNKFLPMCKAFEIMQEEHEPYFCFLVLSVF